MAIAEQAYREYRAKLLSFVRRRVGAAEAEDILQDVFAKLLAQCAESPPRKLHAWLYQVTRNVLVDRARAMRRHEVLPEELPEELPESPVLHELTQCLEPLVRALPASTRDAVRLSELQQIPLKEVARAQGLSLPGVKSRVQRGRRQLKALLLECCRVEFDDAGRVVDARRPRNCC